jgi:hypothetical protein
VLGALREKLLAVAAHLEATHADILAFTGFPKAIWRQAWSQQPPGTAQPRDPPLRRHRRDLPELRRPHPPRRRRARRAARRVDRDAPLHRSRHPGHEGLAWKPRKCLPDPNKTAIYVGPGYRSRLLAMLTGGGSNNEARESFFRRGLAALAEFRGRWLHPPELLRKLGLILSWLILGIIGYESFTWAHKDWMQSRPAITVSEKFTIATLAITFFAAVFALLAYQVSSGTPNLEIGIMLHGQNPYKHKLKYATERERQVILERFFESPAVSGKDSELLWNDPRATTHIAYMWIDNRSRYPAKNPAAILRFGKNDVSPMGLCWIQSTSHNLDGPWKDGSQGPAWKSAAFKTSGAVVLAAQWDGGSENTIHGKSSRRLPDLALITLFSREPESKFKVELLADNYRRVVSVTISFKVD